MLCCCCRCCWLLLLFVIACRMAKFVAGSLNQSDPSAFPSVFFLFIHPRFFLLMYPLAALSLLRPRFAYNASSVITGMRRGKAGVSTPRRSPPYIYISFFYSYVQCLFSPRGSCMLFVRVHFFFVIPWVSGAGSTRCLFHNETLSITQ